MKNHLFILFITSILMNTCQKTENVPTTVNTKSTATYLIDGKSYEGTTTSNTSNGIRNIGIATSNGGSGFIINAMPSQSSGTYSFKDKLSNSTLPSDLTGSSLNPFYFISSGTLTKTGTKSFIFECELYDNISRKTVNGSGKGNY